MMCGLARLFPLSKDYEILTMKVEQFKSGVYFPEIRQNLEAKLNWAEKALETVSNELTETYEKCGAETTEFYQVLENQKRIETTLKSAKTELQHYRECTCGSGYVWHKCNGHPETGTMYCG